MYNAVKPTFKVVLEGGTLNSDLFIDKVTCIKTTQKAAVGGNLFPTNDAAGDSDSNVVSAAWTNTGGALSVDTTDPHSGVRCIKAVKTSGASGQAIIFNFPGTVDKYYLVSFWMKVLNNDGSTMSLNPYNTPVENETAWKQFQYVKKATATGDQGTSITIYGTTTTNEILFDDIDVRELV
jgi:hypothetical protein